jgi:hypothetical protein
MVILRWGQFLKARVEEILFKEVKVVELFGFNLKLSILKVESCLKAQTQPIQHKEEVDLAEQS